MTKEKRQDNVLMQQNEESDRSGLLITHINETSGQLYDGTFSLSVTMSKGFLHVSILIDRGRQAEDVDPDPSNTTGSSSKDPHQE
jgi:hypothetical protein